MNLGYRDVVDAWNHYLEHDNDGGGVVLMGHSQGTGVLVKLIFGCRAVLHYQDRLVKEAGETIEAARAITCGRFGVAHKTAPCQFPEEIALPAGALLEQIRSLAHHQFQDLGGGAVLGGGNLAAGF